MASDDLETEYHLTPRGWIEGTERFFGKVQREEVERPADAIETWVHKIYQRSEWSREERSWHCIWYNPSFEENERKERRSEFPKPTEDFPSN